MNTEDKTLELIEEFLGADQDEFDAGVAELLDADWDGEDMFAA